MGGECFRYVVIKKSNEPVNKDASKEYQQMFPSFINAVNEWWNTLSATKKSEFQMKSNLTDGIFISNDVGPLKTNCKPIFLPVILTLQEMVQINTVFCCCFFWFTLHATCSTPKSILFILDDVGAADLFSRTLIISTCHLQSTLQISILWQQWASYLPDTTPI